MLLRVNFHIGVSLICEDLVRAKSHEDVADAMPPLSSMALPFWSSETMISSSNETSLIYFVWLSCPIDQQKTNKGA